MIPSANLLPKDEEHARLLASIKNLPIGFVMTDRNKKITLSNDTIKKILAIPTDEFTFGYLHAKLSGALNLSRLCDTCMQQKKIQEVNEASLSSHLYLRISVTPIVVASMGDAIIGTVILITDITHEKLVNRTRDEFFAITAHELRTPLAGIRLNSSLLREYLSDPSKADDIRKMVNDIHSCSISLIKIVQDFLDVSRLEQQKITFAIETFDITPIVKNVISELQEIAAKKGLTLSLESEDDASCIVQADQERIKQVIVNLISNALKYTEQGGVSVRINEGKKYIKVRVIDSGIGIQKDDQRRLFRKYAQAGGDIHKRGVAQEVGLGLYISKLLVRGMKGCIYLESSTPNKETVFAFVIPKAEQAK